MQPAKQATPVGPAIAMTEKETKINELFEMVYVWGRWGVEADFESPAFRKKLKEVVALYEN